MAKKTQVNIANARTAEQIHALNQIEAEKICPFCGTDYLKTEHKKPILAETEHWLATLNRWPYKGSKLHLLLIHKIHEVHLDQITSEAWQELKTLTSQLLKQFKIPGATLLMRFGDFHYTGGTVAHLHVQLIAGDPDQSEPVIARVG